MSEYTPTDENFDFLEDLTIEQLRILCVGALQIITALRERIDTTESELADTMLVAEEEKKFDTKTGLLTSTAFKSLTEERMEILRQDARYNWRRRSSNNSASQYLLFMDLDHFKKLNEVLNHEVVDEKILLPTVDQLNSTVRGDDDLIGTQGGDEFLVLLMNVDRVSCGRIANRIQESINSVQIPQTGPYPQLWKYLGVSIGVAEYPYDSSYGDVFNKAHAAHLVSKHAPGRNRIIFAD